MGRADYEPSESISSCTLWLAGARVGADDSSIPGQTDDWVTQTWAGHDRIELARLWGRNVEDFILHLAGDAGVVFNHRPQSLLLNERERSGVQV